MTLTSRIGTRPLLLTGVVVQLAAFAVAIGTGHPTAYAVFAVLSAGALALGTLPGFAVPPLAFVLLIATGENGVLYAGVGGIVLLATAVLTADRDRDRGLFGLALAVLVGAVLSLSWEFLAGFGLAGYALAAAGFVALGAALAIVAGAGAFDTLFALVGASLLVALGLPLTMIVARQDPGLVFEKATNPAVQRSLYITIFAPLLAAVATVALGVPLAYLLSRGFPGHTLVESLVDLPLVVPHSVAGLAILFAFGRSAAFPDLNVYLGLAGMVLAMMFVSAPFAVNAAREGFEATDDGLSRAARSLGANRWETFKRVEAPLAARGVLTGGVLSWARSVSEFGAVAVVAYNVSFFYPPAGENVTSQHAPVFIYNTFTSQGLADSGAISALLLVLVAVIFVLIRTVAYDEGGWP
ncbi:ABC transporter permease [Salarchaeum sp. JOR-1]|uniref:ABC transporter permease n=1 Tax=Salarchaeum sp. JOR-1 TaxID=2599399 RepID=UPI001F10E658|nr:ABC transporter permease [Salarchaeum sp. JOR-1]